MPKQGLVEEQLGALEYDLNRERASVLGRCGRRADVAIERCHQLLDGLDANDPTAVEAYKVQRRAALEAVEGLCLQLEMIHVYDFARVHEAYPVPPSIAGVGL